MQIAPTGHMLPLCAHMPQPVLLLTQHMPERMRAADSLLRDLLCALIAKPIVCDVKTAAAAGQQELCGTGSIARELAREQRAVVCERARVVGGPIGHAAGLLRCILQADAAGTYKGTPTGPACQGYTGL